METILKVNGLCKTMGKRLIIDHLSLETYSGEVFGFLGPNGSGKTTTIKMILGLLKMDEGSASICGFDVQKNFEQAMAITGGIVENPETYNYLTGLQNLRQYARMRGDISEERIWEVIRIVGLENRIKDKVKKYSLGMKQRLGVAQAIMHRPKLLILDEPTNGLDPAGIRDLRDILKRVAHEDGAGVLVSSHLLSEMELMCDRVGIISNGRIIGVQSAKELMSGAEAGQKIMRFTVNPLQTALLIISDMGLVPANITENSFDLTVDGDETVSAVNAALIGGGVMLMGVAAVERSLEDVFLDITSKGGDQIA